MSTAVTGRRSLLRAGSWRTAAGLLAALALPLAGALPPGAVASATAPTSTTPTTVTTPTTLTTPTSLPAPPAVPAATALSLSAAPSRVRAGEAVTLTAVLQEAAGGVPVAGQPVELWAAPARSTAWARIGAATTDASGRVSLRHSPVRHLDLRATTTGSATVAAATSAVRRVEVAARVSAQLSAPAVRAGTSAVVSGTVTPARAGRPVTLHVRSAGTWRAVATTPQSATGTFRFAVTPRRPGWWRYRVTTGGDDALLAAEHVLPSLDSYRLHTYVVVRRGAPASDLEEFTRSVAATFADPRGWSAAHRRFARVAAGGDLSVVLSEARHLPSFSPVCSVRYSCRVGRFVIVNDDRWRSGSPAFPGPLEQYRAMVVNHETGHWLGLGHAGCPRAGAPAPVMQQQSKSMQGCAPNAWPLAHELTAAAPRR